MPFSRTTVLEACQCFQYQNHTGIDTVMLRLQLDQFAQAGGDSKEARLLSAWPNSTVWSLGCSVLLMQLLFWSEVVDPGTRRTHRG
jgi:hypothetical protein